jgi:hypothetical protein
MFHKSGGQMWELDSAIAVLTIFICIMWVVDNYINKITQFKYILNYSLIIITTSTKE